MMSEGYIITISLKSYLNKMCKKAQIPGMALLVYKDGEVLFEENYGYRHVEHELPVTKDTVFGVASITKSFACLAIMQLVDSGKLSVNDPVTKWLPEFSLGPNQHEHLVTIHHLMTHTSGLPGLDAVNMARAKSIASDPDGTYLFGELPKIDQEVQTVKDMMTVLAKGKYQLLGKPGEMFNYSNESYALLQEIIERASEQPFIDYMNEHILEPLNMDRSTFLLSDLESMENITELYAFKQDEEKEVFHSPDWWDVGEIYANGSLKSTASDLMKYLDVYRLNGLVNGKRIISEESIEEMRSSQYILPNDLEYGYGLSVEHSLNGKIYGHGGGIKGVSSFMLVAEEIGVTIVVLTNIADVPAEDIARKSLKYLFDFSDGFKRKDNIKEQLMNKQMQLYQGTYETAEGQKVVVAAESDNLQLITKQNRITINYESDHKFVTNDGKRVAFIMMSDGRVSGLFRGLRFLPKKYDS